MDEAFLTWLLVALLITVILTCFIRCGKWCNRFIEIDKKTVYGTINKQKKDLADKRKASLDEVKPWQTVVSSASSTQELSKKQSSEILETGLTEQQDVKTKLDSKGNEASWVEVKFPVILPSPIHQYTNNFIQWIKTSRPYKMLNDILPLYIVIVLVLFIAAIVLTVTSINRLDDSAIYLLESFNIAFTALYSVLIALIFQNAIEKNKENKKLFQALCGDIKAMAIWLCALTDDNVKYKIKCGNGGGETKEKDACIEEGYQEIKTSKNVETQFAKIRYLLSVLAPVAKHVLRNAEEPDNPTYDQLDDKYRVKVKFSNDCFWGPLERLGFVARTIKTDTSQTWKNLALAKKKESVNMIKVYLYEKIKAVQQNSDMDLFETLMYCLLDEINRLREYELGLTEKDYAKERDLISKWQDIYGSWGPMASLTMYRTPYTVRFTLGISLFLYTVSMSLFMKSTSYIKFMSPGIEDSWYNEQVTTTYMNLYCIGLSFLQVFPFAWFWFLAERISQPFKKSNADSEIIDKDAKDTQRQVNKLMSTRATTDVQTLLEFDLGLDASLKTAEGRDSIKTGTLYERKAGERKNKRPRNSIYIGRGGGGMRPRNVIRYKNVNF
tara:strand:- start:935 stop:2764 length:1830 start_codon:yes stop_codon:yes gene_type:complete